MLPNGNKRGLQSWQRLAKMVFVHTVLFVNVLKTYPRHIAKRHPTVLAIQIGKS